MEGRREIPEQGEEAGKGKTAEKQADERARRSLVIHGGWNARAGDGLGTSFHGGWKINFQKEEERNDKGQKVMRLEEELEMVRLSMEKWKLEIRNDEVYEVLGDQTDAEKDSLKIRTVVIETSPVRNIILKFEESLVIGVADD